ncbi:MAG TPA: DegT/DnrJ/EryC1/StrS aminotransferase family protein [Candidatus Altiarchaeales archaeon]|nr:DegT/DnrJ/EryC1/StrS aminotransferase family protein [Candidatus Altiarchaeales archaeon]
MIPIAKPIIGDEEREAVLEVLNSGIIAQGPRVREFELAFSEFTGTEFAIAVNSGTAALHIALLAHDIGKGDEVITTPFTFIATSNSILFTGARPVFVDIEEETFNIDPDRIQERITGKTRALLPVHLYGHPADMRAIMEIAEDHKLLVIEDACQAHGAEFNGKRVGSFGTGCFSFYPTKNMTTSEGGMITTDDRRIAERARMLRDHGSRERYIHEILGFNLRMTDISAVIGLCQLRKLPEFNRRRIENAQTLNRLIHNERIITPRVRENCKHVFHQYTIRVTDDRDRIVNILNEKGIGTGIYYPIPIHKQKLYKDLGYNETLPVSERLANEVISLPVHPSVTMENLKYISSVLNGL